VLRLSQQARLAQRSGGRALFPRIPARPIGHLDQQRGHIRITPAL
jgi:hypothetical protein